MDLFLARRLPPLVECPTLQLAARSAGTSGLDGSLPPCEGSGRVVSVAGDKRERKQQPANKMTREEAERLRELLRDTKPADFADPSALQRIGRAIARAVYGLSKRDW